MGLVLEKDFQRKLIIDIKSRFPGCIVMKTDPNYIQGIPDLLILYKNKWAMLEVKREGTSKRRPNQEFYINKLNKMSFARIIYPENKEEVLNELQRTLQS